MAAWLSVRLRRGVLPEMRPRWMDVMTGRTVLHVWLVAACLGAMAWLVIGGPWSRGPAGLEALDLVVAPLSVAWGLGLLTCLIGGVGFLALRLMAPMTVARTATLVLAGVLVLLALGVARGVMVSGLLPVWAIPAAGPAMLAALLLGPTTAMVLATTIGFLVGLMADQSLGVALAVTAGAIAGIVTVRGARRRGHLIRAGVWSGAAQALVILAIQLLAHAGWREAVTAGVVGGCWSGLASFVVTVTLLPVLEHFFGLVTNITLLELSDLNHPLLKELSLKAPGTYHHSLIVATLAETACEAIGANGLLARVGCYFHDIGKMPKADYFVENQQAGPSRHDALSPSMSSLIIINHVKEGIELAKAHRLNQAIVDFIPGHHGTGVIYYFYRRALEQVEDERLLKEESFRYPGPRPRTRETAVGLLADSVEAACRALPEHAPAKLSAAVRRIINNKFIDGQLDECDLTLRDLERIAEAFVRALRGVYHQRVPYPIPPGEDVEETFAGPDSRSAAPSGPTPPHPAGGAAGPRGA